MTTNLLSYFIWINAAEERLSADASCINNFRASSLNVLPTQRSRRLCAAVPQICLQHQIKFIPVSFVAIIISQACGRVGRVAQKQRNRKCVTQNRTRRLQESIHSACTQRQSTACGLADLWRLHAKLCHIRSEQSSKANLTKTDRASHDCHEILQCKDKDIGVVSESDWVQPSMTVQIRRPALVQYL